jgi:hypothetical protein
MQGPMNCMRPQGLMVRKSAAAGAAQPKPRNVFGLARFIRNSAQHFPTLPIAPLNTPLPDDGR